MARPRLAPGALRNRVTIQSQDRVSDGRGGHSLDWVNVAAVFASITPASSREAFQQGQLQGSRTHVVTARYIDGVQPSMRVVWGSRVFEIIGVRCENEERRVLLLDCVEERI